MRLLNKGLSGAGLLAASLVVGCGGEADPAASAADSWDTVGSNTEQALCKLWDSVKVLSIGVTGSCKVKEVKNLYYHGSYTPSGTVSDFAQRPFVASAATYCAVKDAHGAQNSTGVRSTTFGKFGTSTRVNITKSQDMTLDGERIASIWLFGKHVDLDIQRFSLNFSTEDRPAGTINAVNAVTGQPYTQQVDQQKGWYMEVLSHSPEWGVGGTIPIPTPVPGLSLTITPSFKHDATTIGSARFFEGLNNNLVHNSETDTTQLNAPNHQYDWATALTAPEQCQATCGPLCNCPGPVTFFEALQHDRVCSGGPCDYSKLSDGVIPYEGFLGGATQTSLYRDNLVNWVHFGHPGSTFVVDDTEPKYDLKANNKGKTSEFSLAVGARYGIGAANVQVDVNTSVGFRSGLAIRQNRGDGPVVREMPEVVGQSTVALDSQSSVGITAGVSVTVPIFGTFTKNITLLKNVATSGTAESRASLVQFGKEGTSSFVTYNTKRTGNVDAAQGMSQCLSTKPTALPNPPADTASFLKQVTTETVRQIHPCHVQSCDAQNKLQVCEMDTTTGAVTCTSLGTSCDQCTTYHATLCDEAGATITDADSGQPIDIASDPTNNNCIR